MRKICFGTEPRPIGPATRAGKTWRLIYESVKRSKRSRIELISERRQLLFSLMLRGSRATTRYVFLQASSDRRSSCTLEHNSRHSEISIQLCPCAGRRFASERRYAEVRRDFVRGNVNR